MPASRSVVSVLLRELGDFSLHPQGRPCGRPPAALRPGSDATVAGVPASPSTPGGAGAVTSVPHGPRWVRTAAGTTGHERARAVRPSVQETQVTPRSTLQPHPANEPGAGFKSPLRHPPDLVIAGLSPMGGPATRRPGGAAGTRPVGPGCHSSASTRSAGVGRRGTGRSPAPGNAAAGPVRGRPRRGASGPSRCRQSTRPT